MKYRRASAVLASVALAAAGLLAAPGPAGATTASPWHVMPALASPPGARGTAVTAVSCATTSNCLAAGVYYNSRGTEFPLAERWNGTTWTAKKLRLPPHGDYGKATAVSCPTTTWCVVLGSYDDPGVYYSDALPVAWEDNDGTWTTTRISGPPFNYLDAVSCTGVDLCTAVGSYEIIGVEEDYAAAYRLDGSTWSLQQTVSSGTRNEEFTGVSCRTATECVATGDEQHTADDNSVPMIQYWNGQSWRVMHRVLLPTGLTSGTLSQVSCTAVNSCTAVGSYNPVTGPKLPLAEHWNGGDWKPQSIPLPPGGTSGELTALTCLTSTRHCVAVGDYYTAGDGYYGLVENRNGTAWTSQRLADGGLDVEPTGLSCRPAGVCVAVGYTPEERGGA